MRSSSSDVDRCSQVFTSPLHHPDQLMVPKSCADVDRFIISTGWLTVSTDGSLPSRTALDARSSEASLRSD